MSFQLFDRIRSFLRANNIYRHENLLQDQPDISRAIQNGEFINYATQGLIDQTNLQINRMERYKDFDQMDEMGEISLALDLYADEASQIDPQYKRTIAIRARSKEVKDELESFFFDVWNIDSKLRPLIRYLCKYGDFAAEVVPTINRDGIATIRPFNIYNFLRVETRHGDLVGFYFTDPNGSSLEPEFLHPWQVIHMRLSSLEGIYQPYGRSILDGSRKDFRRLRLMEDAALIYRITRAPEKRVFTIPVGNIPSHEVNHYLNQISDNFKKTRFFDPSTGEVNFRYFPLIQEDDFWMPERPDGSGPKVTTLAGAENLDQIADIEYFKKKMISALKIPFARVGIGSDSGVGSDKSLSSTSTDFAKSVQWVQREVAIGLKKIALIHLALKGFETEDLSSFDVTLTSSSAIDELYRIEVWNSRAGVISTLKETNLFPVRWILKSFTDLTEEEIELMEEEKAEEKPEPTEDEEEGEEELGGLPDIGELPGLGENMYDKKLEDKLITEVKNRKLSKKKNREKRLKEISESKTRMPDSFTYLLNEKELDGIPLKDDKDKDDGEDDGDVVLSEEAIAANKEAEEAKEENKTMLIESFNEEKPDEDINVVVSRMTI